MADSRRANHHSSGAPEAVGAPPDGPLGRIRRGPPRFERAALVITPEVTLSVARDPADNRGLEAAVEASIDAVVTGDDDLLALESYERIPIAPARAFLELLNGQRRRLP